MASIWRRSALITVLAVSATACGFASYGSASSPSASDASCTTTKAVADDANGTAVHLCVGQPLQLELHSTYWQNIATSNDAVLVMSDPTVAQALSPTACVPGAGCGTLVTGFKGVAAGTAQISAHRTTCGEALLCQPDQRSFSVTVDVS